MRSSTVLASLGAVLLICSCNQILNSGDYHVTGSGGATGSSVSTGSCSDSPPGCFCGAPQTREQFLNQCTDAACVPFDASRVTGLEGGMRPDLPPTGGVSTVGVASSSSVTSGAGGAGGGGSGNPSCASLPHPVYVTGSSAVKPFLSTVAQYLASLGEMTVVYLSQGSCTGVDAILSGTPMQGTAAYWDGDEANVALAERACDLDGFGNNADVGISDVFATTCLTLPQGLPSGVTDDFGPIQAMTLVTSAGSSQASISADAAFFAYGFGNESTVAPWNDETFLVQRTASSGTQNIIAKSIGVPADRFRGKATTSSDSMLSTLLQLFQKPGGAEATLGMLSADYADANRALVSVLAFQDVGQTCGYYPDSSATALDKLNVRDGHYPLWGPVHLFTRSPSPIARKLVNYLIGVAPLEPLDLIKVYFDAHVIPNCAMHVSRTSDGGPPTPFVSDTPCNCAYDVQVKGATDCKKCMFQSECPSEAPNCSFGYCEK